MTILLDPLAVDASRSTPRDEEAPVPQLWASSARIVEVEFRMHCNCFACNAYKGPNLTAIDPKTKALVPLFNPRRQSWDEHFVMAGAEIRGLTPTGRATVHLLNMNAARRIALRRAYH